MIHRLPIREILSRHGFIPCFTGRNGYAGKKAEHEYVQAGQY
ncbi:MAG: hypothetical protein P8182_03275 [Deltaproteobacteria bacterium]